MELNKIYNIDALTGLKMLPDNSIDCVVTSPPYWGLRWYGDAAVTIWGGDADCKHEWLDFLKKGISGGENSDVRKIKGQENFQIVPDNIQAFCVKCGAWRGQLGHEPTPELYVEHLVEIFREVRRVLKPEGTLWLNLGDSYWANRSKLCETGGVGKTAKCGREHQGRAGFGKHPLIKPKDLIGIPWMVAFALRNDGWWLRQDIIWEKVNAMPESVKDRCTKAHEYIFLLSKSQKYYYNHEAIKENAKPESEKRYKSTFYTGKKERSGQGRPGNKSNTPGYKKWTGKRNKRSVWHIPTQPFKGAHFACVDEKTECLTISGWKKYNELKQGEIIATFDLEHGKLRWERLEDIFVYEYDGKLIKTLNPNANFLYTPNHRVVCRNWRAKTKTWSGFYIKTADEISTHDRFPVSAEWEDGSYGLDPEEPNPNICELLGWICAEGHYNKYSIDIYQSLTRNKEKVARIEELLNIENIKYTKRISIRDKKGFKNYTMVCFTIAWENAKKLMLYLPDKKPSYRLLLWSKEGITRFIKGFVYGDGYIRKDGRWSITQKDEQVTDVVMALLFRLGYSVKKSFSNGTYRLYVTNKRLTSARNANGHGLNIREIQYRGKVWCPKTPSTTFVARRNGMIIITGNSFPEALVEPCILAGCPEGGIVLDPFMGSGTVAVVAKKLNRNFVGFEINPDYCKLAEQRLNTECTS